MSVPELAEDVSKTAQEELGDDLLAVGWYRQDQDDRTGTIYLSEEFGEYKEPGRGVLETSLLESIGSEMYERPHEERLQTTVRIYESIIDICIHLDSAEGIVVAVRKDGDYLLEDFVETMQETVSQAD